MTRKTNDDTASKKDTSSQGAEERILWAAIQAIEKVGLQRVTTRGIAEIAGVNSAAINYYYRSKDRLIEKVMERTLENAFGDVDDFIPPGTLHDVEPLKHYFRHMMDGMLNYPGIVNAHIYEPIVTRSHHSESVRRLNDLMQRLYERIRPNVDVSRHDELRMALIQFESAFLFSGMAPTIFADFAGDLLADEERAGQYVDQLIDTLLKPFLPESPGRKA